MKSYQLEDENSVCYNCNLQVFFFNIQQSKVYPEKITSKSGRVRYVELLIEAFKLVKFVIQLGSRLQTIYKFNQRTSLQKIFLKVLSRNIIFV